MDLTTYGTFELSQTASEDPWAVRDEGYRRQAVAEKKLVRIRKQLAVAQKEMAEAQKIIGFGLDAAHGVLFAIDGAQDRRAR